MRFSVVISTYNPEPSRLERTLRGLAAQTLDTSEWELIIVDNASDENRKPQLGDTVSAINARIIHEPELGLTSARRCGVKAATGKLIVLVDDDNVLAPDYLEIADKISEIHPKLGAWGGKSVAEFERDPEPWKLEFVDLLAIRDLGESPIVAAASSAETDYPVCAPIGAGMVLRRDALTEWIGRSSLSGSTDRKGASLTSGGDNEIVLSCCASGWDVAYFPNLSLTHLIPQGRLDTSYLGRLNRGIQCSWIQVLDRHGIRPAGWSPIPRWSVPLRQIKAWFTRQVWSGQAAWVRWQGACGHFEGRALIAEKGHI